MANNRNSSDSKEQQLQKNQAKGKANAAGDGYDKKLNGPNRPSV
ncbi:spore protein [Paenibacillus cremeus]|nr:spore protein [Paenibacillus cremeus]